MRKPFESSPLPGILRFDQTLDQKAVNEYLERSNKASKQYGIVEWHPPRALLMNIMFSTLSFLDVFRGENHHSETMMDIEIKS